NDRTMCSFLSNEKLDQLVDGLRAATPAKPNGASA
ncbi:MAG: NAD(P)H-dependent oxidoreductase subunit E, partial [Burkholderiaceae bacterium]|nr:NAD(P)H-dependent oxidoreductase subunit E [Burkholderiaceae bacterium]